MSKIKMSFSLFFAIILVGILSTVAFAAGPSFKAYQSGQAITVNISNAVLNTDYPLTIVGGSINDNTVKINSADTTHVITTTTTNSDGTTSNLLTYSYKLTPAQLGPNYVVGITGVGSPSTITTTVVADSEGTPTLDALKTGVNAVPGMNNSNHTGYDNPRKNRQSPTKQKIHGFYQNNTNSCASCHQTHTATNGESLLFKDGAYSTCSACHDGTTGGQNAFTPLTTSTDVTNIDKGVAGTFNVQQVDANGINHNGSLHQADGSLQVSAAPGGNHVAGDNLTAATWGSEFDCASCHAAHGSGSNSAVDENNLNLDPLGWGGVQYSKTGTLDQQNGKLFKNIKIVDTTKAVPDQIPASFVTPYILVISKASATDAANYWYSRAGVGKDTLVIQTYRWNGSPTDDPAVTNKTTLYVPDYSLWLRADPSGHAATPFTFANTVLKDNGGSDVTSQNNMTTVWRDGFAFGPGVATVASADVSIGIDVETTGNIANLYDSNSKGYVPDSGTEMSKYCAACHTDYLSGTRTNNTGVYSTAHRHATAQDRLTCVRCHYAHGSEALTMKDANDNTFTSLKSLGLDANTALQYLADPNPSSAIKRYTGMSVCYACHGKGEAFLSNPNITGDSTTHQYLKSGDPGLAVKGGDTTPGAGRTDLTTRHNANTAGDTTKAGVN
jgi:hypothetical protein